MTRIALLTEIPAPYRIPLFNALADRAELEVLFLRGRHPERPYRLHEDELRFRWRVLPGRHVLTRRWWLVVNKGVAAALRRARPDVVILGGWNQPAFWLALAWARARRVPVLLWVESTGRDDRSGRLEALKRALLASAQGFVVPGRAAADYLRSLGVPPERITVAPNAVDPGLFRATPRPPTNGRPRVLSVARLSVEKGVDVLVRAVDGLDADVVLAGSGPEESRLRSLAGPNVRFLGNVERDDLPALYASADVAVVPSRSDTWGMALNEAALAGLPLVATEVVGAAADLIEEGKNGFRVPPDDVEALHAAIARILADDDLRAAMARRSAEIAARFTPETWAERVVEAAAAAGGR
jgi:glycosyltransferase involved in cell wall biosynthesis